MPLYEAGRGAAEVDRLATEYPEDAAANVVVRNAVASARSHLRGRSAR